MTATTILPGPNLDDMAREAAECAPFSPARLYVYVGGSSGIFLLCGRCLEAARLDVMTNPAAYADCWLVPWTGWRPDADNDPDDECDDCGRSAKGA